MIYVVTADRERLDRVARTIYGTEGGGTVEALLAANPGLAARGAYLPRGTKVTVPEKPAPAPNPAFVRPWE